LAKEITGRAISRLAGILNVGALSRTPIANVTTWLAKLLSQTTLIGIGKPNHNEGERDE
jgi:hypothetical protein